MIGPSRAAIVDDDRFTIVQVTADGRASSQSVGAMAADARDKWYVIAPLRARLHPEIAQIVRHEGNLRPDIDLFYCDEVVLCHGRDYDEILLKPDLDIALLIAED